MMQFGIITLFPEMFDALKWGVTGRAIKNSLVKLHFWNLYEFATDKHRTIDDRPYGGGPGMLMKAEPLQKAIQKAKVALPHAKVIYPSPRGKPFTQAMAKTASQNLTGLMRKDEMRDENERKTGVYSTINEDFERAFNKADRFLRKSNLIFVAGRYEGMDERLIQTEIDEEWSIGDFVLSGGELAIMAMMDAMIRLSPEVLGNEHSAQHDSFTDGLLEHPQYTRPETINGISVPEVLRNGNHKAISTWQLKQALGETWLKRPDLLEKRNLSKIEQKLLQEFINERSKN